MLQKRDSYYGLNSLYIPCIDSIAILFMLASPIHIRSTAPLFPDEEGIESQSTIARIRENREILN